LDISQPFLFVSTRVDPFAEDRLRADGVRKTGCGSFRGLRGGSWNNNENNLRSSNRNNDNPDNENNNNGFRVASP